MVRTAAAAAAGAAAAEPVPPLPVLSAHEVDQLFKELHHLKLFNQALEDRLIDLLGQEKILSGTGSFLNRLGLPSLTDKSAEALGRMRAEFQHITNENRAIHQKNNGCPPPPPPPPAPAPAQSLPGRSGALATPFPVSHSLPSRQEVICAIRDAFQTALRAAAAPSSFQKTLAAASALDSPVLDRSHATAVESPPPPATSTVVIARQPVPLEQGTDATALAVPVTPNFCSCAEYPVSNGATDGKPPTSKSAFDAHVEVDKDDPCSPDAAAHVETATAVAAGETTQSLPAVCPVMSAPSAPRGNSPPPTPPLDSVAAPNSASPSLRVVPLPATDVLLSLLVPPWAAGDFVSVEEAASDTAQSGGEMQGEGVGAEGVNKSVATHENSEDRQAPQPQETTVISAEGNAAGDGCPRLRVVLPAGILPPSDGEWQRLALPDVQLLKRRLTELEDREAALQRLQTEHAKQNEVVKRQAAQLEQLAQLQLERHKTEDAEALQRRIADYAETVAQLQQRIGECECEKAELAARLDSLDSQLQTLFALRCSKAKLSEMLSEAQQQLQDATEKIRELEAQRSQQQQQQPAEAAAAVSESSSPASEDDWCVEASEVDEEAHGNDDEQDDNDEVAEGGGGRSSAAEPCRNRCRRRVDLADAADGRLSFESSTFLKRRRSTQIDHTLTALDVLDAQTRFEAETSQLRRRLATLGEAHAALQVQLDDHRRKAKRMALTKDRQIADLKRTVKDAAVLLLAPATSTASEPRHPAAFTSLSASTKIALQRQSMSQADGDVGRAASPPLPPLASSSSASSSVASALTAAVPVQLRQTMCATLRAVGVNKSAAAAGDSSNSGWSGGLSTTLYPLRVALRRQDKHHCTPIGGVADECGCCSPSDCLRRGESHRQEDHGEWWRGQGQIDAAAAAEEEGEDHQMLLVRLRGAVRRLQAELQAKNDVVAYMTRRWALGVPEPQGAGGRGWTEVGKAAGSEAQRLQLLIESLIVENEGLREALARVVVREAKPTLPPTDGGSTAGSATDDRVQ